MQPKQGSLDVLVECMMSIAKEDDKLPLSEAELLTNFQTVESQIAERKCVCFNSMRTLLEC